MYPILKCSEFAVINSSSKVVPSVRPTVHCSTGRKSDVNAGNYKGKEYFPRRRTHALTYGSLIGNSKIFNTQNDYEMQYLQSAILARKMDWEVEDPQYYSLWKYIGTSDQRKRSKWVIGECDRVSRGFFGCKKNHRNQDRLCLFQRSNTTPLRSLP